MSIVFIPQLAEALLDKEVLNYDDIAVLIGECPYGDKRPKIDSETAAGPFTTEKQLPNV